MKQTIEKALQMGVAAHKGGKLEEAERVYRAILEARPKHPEANHNLGTIMAATKNFGSALPFFKIAVDANPEIGQYWFSYIDALIKEEQLDNANRVIERAKEQGVAEEKLKTLKGQLIALNRPDNVGSLSPSQELLNSLLEHYQSGRFDDAEQLAESITQQFPEHQFSWKVLGELLGRKGKKTEALSPNQKAVEINPQDAEAHNNLGVTLQELGRLKESEASLSRAIVLKPDYAEGHNNLGITLQKLGRLDAAAASLRQAIALNSDFAVAHNNLGNVFQDLGRFKEAEASYNQAIALKPDYAEARYNIGILLFQSKQYNIAAKQFELIDIHHSKLYAVKCSYFLEDETIFSKKLDSLIDEGEVNAVVGSLSCCSEIKYGIDKPNPFCNDPLNYVVTTDLHEQYDFENIFIKTARDVLMDNSVSHKAQGHLTNGTQTAGNIFALGKVSRTEIESIIRTEVEKYRIYYKDSEEGFIKNWPASYEIKGWLVCMQSGGKLAPHMHDTGWITGAVYINVPPKSEAYSGCLGLCIGDQKRMLGVENSQEIIIDVVTGSLCLFPSSLHHYTIPFEEEENRIVLAFDIIPKKKF